MKPETVDKVRKRLQARKIGGPAATGEEDPWSCEETPPDLLYVGIEEFNKGLYFEPPKWYYPVRHTLGAVLLKAGRAKDAEAVYRDDLRRHPENGWSLRGLAEALRAEHRPSAAAAAEVRFRRAWAHADVKLAASAF